MAEKEKIKTIKRLFTEGAPRGREIIIIGENGEKYIFLMHL